MLTVDESLRFAKADITPPLQSFAGVLCAESNVSALNWRREWRTIESAPRDGTKCF